MLTKKDAIAVGKAITAGATGEMFNHFNQGNEAYAIRGATYRMLHNLWYDVLPPKVREAFDWKFENFVDEVWK